MYTYTACSNKSIKRMPGKNPDNLFMCSRMIVGDNVRISGRVFMTSVPDSTPGTGAATLICGGDEHKDEILLQDNVWLQAGVSVMPGVTIGKGAIVIKGSVVTKDIPEGVVAGGVPARVLYRQRAM